MRIVGTLVRQITLHLGRGHHAIAVFVDSHMDYITLAALHALLLLAKRTEEVFHQPPVEKGAILVDPRHLKACEIAHLGQWL